MSTRPDSLAGIANSTPLLPLAGALLLPQTQRPLMIFEPRYVALIDHVLATNRVFGLIQPQDSQVESPKDNDAALKKVGTLGYLRAFEEQDNGHYMIVLDGVCRFDLGEEIFTRHSFRSANIDTTSYAEDFDPKSGSEGVNREEFLSLLRTYSNFANFDFDWEGIQKLTTTQLVNMCCVMSPYGAIEKQALLEATSLDQRAQTLIALAEMEMTTANATNPGAGLQ